MTLNLEIRIVTDLISNLGEPQSFLRMRYIYTWADKAPNYCNGFRAASSSRSLGLETILILASVLCLNTIPNKVKRFPQAMNVERFLISTTRCVLVDDENLAAT